MGQDAAANRRGLRRAMAGAIIDDMRGLRAATAFGLVRGFAHGDGVRTGFSVALPGQFLRFGFCGLLGDLCGLVGVALFFGLLLVFFALNTLCFQVRFTLSRELFALKFTFSLLRFGVLLALLGQFLQLRFTFGGGGRLLRFTFSSLRGVRGVA